jgi:hypothetical protein
MKNYVAPEMEVIDMSHQTELLSGSDNQYWKGPWGEPDPPAEGCKSSWHC